MRLIWILTAVLAPLSHTLAAGLDSTDLAVRRHADRPEDCDPAFFEMTKKNLKESGSDEFYRDFILETSKEHPDEYLRLGEVSFFAHHAFNGLEVACSSRRKGCTGIPTCRAVLDHVQRHGGDKDKARKIYFSIKKIEYIVDAIFWFHRVSPIIEHYAGLVSEMIVKDFGPKRKGTAEDNRKIIKAGLKAVATITKSFVVIVASDYYGFSIGSIFSLAMKLVEEFGEHAKEHVDAELLEKTASGTIDFPALEYAKMAVRDLFAVEAGRSSSTGPKEKRSDNAEQDQDYSHRSALLKKQIIKVTSAVRETISAILDIIVAGNALLNPNFNYLYELMSRHDWSDKGRLLYESFDEKLVTRIFEASLITTSWEDGRCYQKCVCKDDGSATNLCSNEDANAKYRLCPNDGKGCACQLQCLSTNMDKRKNEVQLLGMEQLASWDVDFMKVLVKSYATYRTTKGILPDIDRSLLKSVKTHGDLLELPTCASSQLDMGDFRKDEKHNSLFPCTCGDWRSSETQIFMKQLGFGKFQPGYKTELAEELFTHDCPRSLSKAKLKPFNHFLALCELGVKWPHKGDMKSSKITQSHKHHVHMNMVDSRCSKLRKETEGMTEDEANFHFCVVSETAKEVFDDELGHISGAGLPLPGLTALQVSDGGNHWHMCKKWLHYF